MKAKAALIILAVASLALGIALYMVAAKASKEKEIDEGRISVSSNNVVTLQHSLDQERNEKMQLQTNLAETRTDFSNKLAATEASLSTTAASLAKAQADAKAAAEAAAEELRQRDKKIADLETQRQSLDDTIAQLGANITNLETQMAVTKKKLDASEGDRQFLLKELERLRAEKADLEKKFNDLAALREQVRKLKDELALSKRLDWIRRGLYNSTGVKGFNRPSPVREAPSTNGLNVELRQDGGVKIERATNAPAVK
jgi:chromosome segregation ATPase